MAESESFCNTARRRSSSISSFEEGSSLIKETECQEQEARRDRRASFRKAHFAKRRSPSICSDRDKLELIAPAEASLSKESKGSCSSLSVADEEKKKRRSWRDAHVARRTSGSLSSDEEDCQSLSSLVSTSMHNQFTRRRSMSSENLQDLEEFRKIYSDEEESFEEEQKSRRIPHRVEHTSDRVHFYCRALLCLMLCAFISASLIKLVINFYYYQATCLMATTPIQNFTPVPEAVRKIACIDRQMPVRRAFKSRGYEIREITNRNYERSVMNCAVHGEAAIMWTKDPLERMGWNASKPWQRHSWLPFQDVMSTKSDFLENMRDYAAKTGSNLEFLPDSYVLPHDHAALLQRMRSVEQGGGGGTDEPWVVKLPDVDNGIGIAILGPQSTELSTLLTILESSLSDNGPNTLSEIRERIVFEQKNDTRAKEHIDMMKRTAKYLDKDIIVQSYVCDELTYRDKKFDLRVYFLVASVDPLVVLYHDGALRVSMSNYQEEDFSKTADHLTNINRNSGVPDHNATVVFDDWNATLKEYVAVHSARFAHHIRQDPLNHIRKQMKAAIADTIASVRDKAFHGHRTYTSMEDGFALLGADFIIDIDLNIWMTEAQSSPGLGHETPSKRIMFDRLLMSTVDVLEEVTAKQVAGEPVLPLKNPGTFDLIYTDDFHFRYQGHTRTKKKHSTCAIKQQRKQQDQL